MVKQPRDQQTDAQAAVAVALAGSAGTSRGAFLAALAPLLLPFMPSGLLSGTDAAADAAAGVAEDAAKLLYEAEPITVPRSAGFSRTAALEALSYRAAYVRAAVGRLARAVLNSEGGDRGAALRKALEAERRNLASHVEMTRKRLAGAKATDAMIELHGWVLNWSHRVTRTPEEFRPAHKAADGLNVNLRKGMPASVVAAPGVLPGCSCAWRAPKQGARMLV